jgi:hypothetical protein
MEDPKNMQADEFASAQSFRVGYDNEQDPNYMLVNIPIQGLTEDMENGSALLRGKMDELKQIVLGHIVRKRQRRAKLQGILNPGGMSVS